MKQLSKLMRQKLPKSFLLILGVFFLSNAYANPELSLQTKNIKMGSVTEGKIYKYTVEAENTGDSDIYLAAVTPSCDCVTIIEPEDELTLKPGEKTTIRFDFNSKGLEGEFKKSIFIYSNDSINPVQRIDIKGISSVLTERIVERAKKYGIFVIIGSGLIDGINPCAFTVLVFFISFLTFSGYNRRQIIQTGLAFIAAVFLTYFLIGMGIFRIVQGLEIFRRISNIIRLSTGSFAIVLGIISIYDFIIFKITKNPEKIKLKLPQSVKKQIQGIIRQKTDIRSQANKTVFKIFVSAFVTGFLISLLESICTGQSYLPTVMFMFRIPELRIKAFWNLIIYNFMFILPLLFILIFGIMGLTSESFGKIAYKHLAAVKLATALVFFVLGISLFIIK